MARLGYEIGRNDFASFFFFCPARLVEEIARSNSFFSWKKEIRLITIVLSSVFILDSNNKSKKTADT